MKTREHYLNLLKTHISNPKMIAHCLASEAVMRALAVRLGDDVEKWGLAGLMHDLDVEITNGDSFKHGNVSAQMLREEGFPEDAVEAILLHNEKATGRVRSDRFHHAL